MTQNIRIVQTAIHPDLDAVACAVGYSYLLNRQGIKALPSMETTEAELMHESVLSAYGKALNM